jgi:hypothetical protein
MSCIYLAQESDWCEHDKFQHLQKARDFLTSGATVSFSGNNQSVANCPVL